MSLIEAGLYFVLAYFLMPKNRDEMPLLQLGFDEVQLMQRAVELSFYEKAIWEVIKVMICNFGGYDFGLDYGWCVPDLDLTLDED